MGIERALRSDIADELMARLDRRDDIEPYESQAPAAMEAMQKELADTERKILGLEQEVQNEHLDNSIQHLREQAIFLRQMIEKNEIVNEKYRQYRVKEGHERPNTIH